jgi:methyl-accepting chemotaxis protein
MSDAKPIRTDFTAGFQIRFILAMALGAFLTTLAIYFYFDEGLGAGYFDALTTFSTIENALTSSLILTFCLQLFLIFLLTIVLTLFVTHKIAGPVFRYEDSLTKILAGDLTCNVRTRDGDQLKPLVDSMNLWQSSLRETYLCAAKLESALAAHLEGATQGGKPDHKPLHDALLEFSRHLGVTSKENRHE